MKLTDIMTRSTDMEKITESLCRLINYNTTTDDGSTEECAAYIAGRLQSAGIRTKVFGPGHQVYAEILGRSKDTILLHAHMDTASYKREDNWHVPPERASIQKGCICGRGALDCKGQIAVWMRLMEDAAAACSSGMLPGLSLAILITDREEGGGEDGLAVLMRECPELFESIRLVIGEGGGFPFPYRNETYYTLQTGELETDRMSDGEGWDRKPLEDVLQKGIERGYYSEIVLDYAKDWPEITGRKLDLCIPAEHLDRFLQHAPVSTIVKNYGDVFQTALQSAVPGARLMPWITPGYSDNRWFRKLGIPTAGFFPLDERNAVSGIHGADEYISRKSLQLAYDVMTAVLHRLLSYDRASSFS